ncbi:MAG: hypothetical protein RID11_00420 [Roseovarius sp.]|jgi:hypothetical protein|uniref:hypothetical protein n=1 Tax=Roseovarius sp. TaxID=1486281 RepID=UPI0032EF22C8
MTDRNSLLISALAMAITVGNLAISLATPGPDHTRIEMVAKAAPDRHAPMKTDACTLALTDLPAN